VKNKNYQWLTIITISLIVATINIFHVIIGHAKTPIGFTYLATGHYYLDYFEYLQHIASGLAGRWLPLNYFSTDDFGFDTRFFPYIMLGKIAWIFHLTPMAAYWTAVFFLTFFTLIGFYFIINLVLNKEVFYLKIIAFLIAVFSGPAYQILIKNGQLILNPYDFWYGPATFIRRFGVVPYHTLGLLLLLVIIVVINKTWRMIPDLSKKAVLMRGLGIASLMIILMTFSPMALISLIPALLIISAIRFVKEKNNRFKIFLLNFIILVLTIPIGIFLRSMRGYGGFNFEISWIEKVPWWFLLLNLGPIILFFPFGILDYLKTKSFLKEILLIFTIVSYVLFLSPAAYYFGIHNLRFFSSISYVFFGVLATFGLKKISSLFNKHRKKVAIMLSLLLIVYSCLLVFDSLKPRILGLDPGTETILTYVPSSLITGLQSLRNYREANVLTGPYGPVGILVPIFSYRRIYVGPQEASGNLKKKQLTVNFFYEGKMTDQEAKNFLKTNNLGFVILTPLDNYDVKNISRYRFLKPIYTKESIIIWQVI